MATGVFITFTQQLYIQTREYPHLISCFFSQNSSFLQFCYLLFSLNVQYCLSFQTFIKFRCLFTFLNICMFLVACKLSRAIHIHLDQSKLTWAAIYFIQIFIFVLENRHSFLFHYSSFFLDHLSNRMLILSATHKALWSEFWSFIFY